MPQASTQQFGFVDYQLEVVEFPVGLPAFEQERSFLLIAPSKTKPLVFLQSLENASLCFVTLPLAIVNSSYQLSVSAEDWNILGVSEAECAAVGQNWQRSDSRIECLAMISLTDSRPTANLLAPLVIDRQTKRAVQAIRLDNRYSHQHPLEATVCS